MLEIQKFFLFCSGSQRAILNRAPSDINKQAGIGATIFFTGIFAALAGSYAMYTVFHNYVAAIFIGLLWGLLIFNLDRYIVSSLKIKTSAIKNVGNALPRVFLAVIIALVIAKPLELKIFDSEINAELSIMQLEKLKDNEALVKSRFDDDIAAVKTDIASLQNQIVTKEEIRNNLNDIAIKEADGTGGSQKRNMGPIYKAKKADADNAQQELEETIAEISPLIDRYNKQIELLTNQKSEALFTLGTVDVNGFASRLEALSRASKKSSAIYLASLFIMFLFIIIETTPIFVKLISARSPYDYVLDKHEYAYIKNHQWVTTQLRNDIDSKVRFDNEITAFKTQIAIETEKRILKETIEESFADIKSNKTSWKNIFAKKHIWE